jgi:streptogramin lyase
MGRRWVTLCLVAAVTACGYPALPPLGNGPPADGGTGDGEVDGATPGAIQLELLAGDGNGNGNLDGVGTAARFAGPNGVAISSNGNAYIADQGNATIRKLTASGIVTTFVGTAGARGSDDGTGPAARFRAPTGLAMDASGTLYVADQLAHTVRKITDAGVVTTLAGTPDTAGSDDGTGPAARFNQPTGVAVDATGNVYVADQLNHTIRKITPAGVVSTLAGTAGLPGGEDGTGAAGHFVAPSSLTIDSAGNLYVASRSSAIRKVTPAGVVTTLALNKGIDSPKGAAIDSAGNLYVTDNQHHVVFKLTPSEEVTTFAGSVEMEGTADGVGAAARFDSPAGIAIRGDGTLYVTDLAADTVRAIAPSGSVTTLAGTASQHGSVDGLGAVARFELPGGVAVDRAGVLYVADNLNVDVRKITPAGLVSTLAGTAGVSGSADGAGPLARFSDPFGMAVDSAGNVYVTDGGGATVRRITPAGVTTTLAGVATMHDSVDGRGAVVRFDTPEGVALDRADTVYVTDIGANTLRKITPDGTVTTLAGTARVAGSADGAGAAASFRFPVGVAVDGDGTIYVADFGNHTIRKVTAAGVVTTLAGAAGVPDNVDGTGADARFNNPVGVALDERGNVYVLDLGNASVRKVTPTGVTTTIAGTPGIRGLTLGPIPQFSNPQGIARSGDSLVITDANAVLILRHGAQ